MRRKRIPNCMCVQGVMKLANTTKPDLYTSAIYYGSHTGGLVRLKGWFFILFLLILNSHEAGSYHKEEYKFKHVHLDRNFYWTAVL